MAAAKSGNICRFSTNMRSQHEIVQKTSARWEGGLSKITLPPQKKNKKTFTYDNFLLSFLPFKVNYENKFFNLFLKIQKMEEKNRKRENRRNTLYKVSCSEKLNQLKNL